MLTKEQINELDFYLGKSIRLAQSIEWNVKCIYAYLKTDGQPITSWDQIWDEATELKFDKVLGRLKDIDKENKIFNKFQYEFLYSIKERRNKFCHKMDCRYFYWKDSNITNDQNLEYEKDMKELRRYVSDCEQQEKAIKNKFEKLVRLK